MMAEVVVPVKVPPIAVSAMSALDEHGCCGPCGGGEGIGSGWRAYSLAPVAVPMPRDATGAIVTCVSSDVLLEEVRQALGAEGCFAEIEIVRLLGAAPGQRNWEIPIIGPNTAALM